MATVSRQHSMPSLMEDGEEHSHACCDRKRSPAQFELGAGTRVTGQGGELAARRKNNRARTQSAHRGCARSGLTGGPRIFTTPNYNLRSGLFPYRGIQSETYIRDRPDLIIIWRAARLGDSPPSLEPASLPERTEAERRGRGWRVPEEEEEEHRARTREPPPAEPKEPSRVPSTSVHVSMQQARREHWGPT
ncbi:unnamed protein product [Prorocentrum cordatum]|uniref:Uncharacterized protein n=1 Tax=Prorocentrum cordatum TaxID=2364126 RepID=A0ABN9XY64_9DINO|nr:unnamed protein product [Polarella glacialis]